MNMPDEFLEPESVPRIWTKPGLPGYIDDGPEIGTYDVEYIRADIHTAALSQQTYRYLGKDGKPILARELEDQRDAALEENKKLREALREFVHSCCDDKVEWTGSHWIDFTDLKEAFDVARALLAPTGETNNG